MNNTGQEREQGENRTLFVFLSYLQGSYSRSSVYADEFAYNGKLSVEQISLNPNSRSRYSELKKIVSKYAGQDVVYIVMSPSHYFVPLLRVLTKSPIILDAGWPLSDATTRGNLLGTLNFFKSFLVDFLAFHLSSKVLLESEIQVRRCARRFLLNDRKLSVVYTGVNERRFENAEAECPPELQDWEGIGGFALFRGKYNYESGLERVVQVLTQGFCGYAVICTDLLPFEVKTSPNVIVITRPLSISEMKYVYLNSRFTISQLSSHSRLQYTIPHKVYESIYFNSPIVSFGTEAVKEIFGSNENFVEVSTDSSNSQITELLNKTFLSVKKLEEYKAKMVSEIQPRVSQSRLANDFRLQALRCVKSSITQS
jgi:hypothetical protein